MTVSTAEKLDIPFGILHFLSLFFFPAAREITKMVIGLKHLYKSKGHINEFLWKSLSAVKLVLINLEYLRNNVLVLNYGFVQDLWAFCITFMILTNSSEMVVSCSKQCRLLHKWISFNFYRTYFS